MPVEVKGALNLRKALKNYAPDLAKETTKEVAATLKPITNKARGYLPPNRGIISNWTFSNKNINARSSVFSNPSFPLYNVSEARRGVGYKSTPSKPNRNGWTSLARIFNKTAAGAIYETAGRKTPSSTFVKNLMGKTSNPISGTGKEKGRVIYRAWSEDKGKTRAAYFAALDTVNKRFQQRTTIVDVKRGA